MRFQFNYNYIESPESSYKIEHTSLRYWRIVFTETCYFTECIIHEQKGVIGARRKEVKRLVPRKNIFTYKQYLNRNETPVIYFLYIDKSCTYTLLCVCVCVQKLFAMKGIYCINNLEWRYAARKHIDMEIKPLKQPQYQKVGKVKR